jgi:predicted anti-sigma-YlaC factor YlaD
MDSVGCQRTRFRVSLRLDGVLPHLEAILLDRHLRRCVACRRFADAAERDTMLLRSAEPEVLEGTVVFGETVRNPARILARRGIATAAVGLAAVAASIALTVGTRTPSPDQAVLRASAAATLQDDSLGVQRVSLRRPGASDFVRGVLGLPA